MKRFIVISTIIISIILAVNLPVHIPQISCPIDKDGDGIDDLRDIAEGAKEEVQRKPQYRSAYYQGGYPPESEGVCTDVVWRAFQHAGYDLKELLDIDIRENTSQYPRVEGNPDLI